MTSYLHKIIILSSFILYNLCLPIVDSHPVLSKEVSLVDQCCTMHSHTSYTTHGKDENGQFITLYKTPFYRQHFKKEYCRTNQHAPKSICNQGMCKQQYVKQKAIVREGFSVDGPIIGIRNIRLADGCKFVPRHVQLKANVP